MFKVQKKDGSLQDFDRNKIVNGVVKAGGSSIDAESVATQVEAWLPTVAANGVVNSMDIRNKGLEILRTVNPTVADSFESYQKQG
jgi:transcriptional regulator NrdR family protein